MFWLVSQIWFWILLGAVAGGIIGWALRCRKCEHDTAGLKASLERAYSNNYLETDERRVSGGVGHGADIHIDLAKQLAAEKEEVAGLKAKLALNGATGGNSTDNSFAGLSVFSGSKGVANDDGQLTWRNRYLESRVRFLETKIEEFELTPKRSNISIAHATKDVDTDVDDLVDDGHLLVDAIIDDIEGASQAVSASATHGLSQNKISAPGYEYAEEITGIAPTELSARVDTVEASLSNDARDISPFETGELEVEPNSIDEQTLAWRNRYLEGRVRYLEEEKERSSPVVESDDLKAITVASNSQTASEEGSETLHSLEATSETLSLASIKSDEVDRLRWRTRYLEGRIRFLEEEAAVSALKAEKDAISPKLPTLISEAPTVQLQTERANWRNAYLEERLQFTALSNSSVQNNTKTTLQGSETQKQSNERYQWRETYLAERIQYGEELLELEQGKQPNVEFVREDLQINRLQWRSQYLEEKLHKVAVEPSILASNESHLPEGEEDELTSIAPLQVNVQEDTPEAIVPAVEFTQTDTSEDEAFAAEYLAEVENELVRLKWREAFYASLALRAQANNTHITDTIAESHFAEDTVSEGKAVNGLREVDFKRLEWRNRYLHGRLKYLEENASSASRKESLKQNIETQIVQDSSEQLSAYGDASDTAKLKWRNSYLLGRIGYLEGDESEGDRSFVKRVDSESKPGDALDNLESLSQLKFEATEEKSEPSVSVAFETSRLKAQEKRERKRSNSNSRKKSIGLGKSEIHVESSDQFQETFLKSEYFVSGDSDTGRPAYLTQPLFGTHDELREIAGVGPKIERILHDLGIYHFYQIASWTRKEVEWVDNYLTFKGRIDRENWIEQCKKLARGEETDGQRKYRDGKHT